MGNIYHTYTAEEILYLKEISPNLVNKEITQLFNIKFNLNLSESKIKDCRCKYNIKSKYSNANDDGTFKKGVTAWNKGMKGYTSANKTSFKKGNFAHNRVPLGAERITKDDYIQIKVQDGKLQQNWKGKHVIEWEKVNGKIPKGCTIIFGDGNKRNFDISNLICVTRKQLLGLNRSEFKQNDIDLTKAAINIVDLNYKLTEINKKRR